MLTKILTGLVAAAGIVAGVPAVAAADPEPAPVPLPNINAYPPVKPSEYVVMNDQWYAFTAPGGITCVVQRNGAYGCSGPLPGAPNGANLILGGPGAPGFSSSDAPIFGTVGDVKPLPPNNRLSFGTVSCGTDGVATTCIDTRNQAGFVVSPGGTQILNAINPLVVRPDGTNPFMN